MTALGSQVIFRNESQRTSSKENKCGEIIIVANSKLLFVCTFCERHFQSIVLFRSHIKGQHVKGLQNDYKKKDPLDISKYEKQIKSRCNIDRPKSNSNIYVNDALVSNNYLISTQKCKELENFDDFMSDEHDKEILRKTKRIVENKTKPSINEVTLNENIQSEGTNPILNVKGNSTNGTLFCRDIQDLLSEPMKVSIKKNRKKMVQTCSLCEYIARNKSSLQVHMYSQHGTGTRYQCEECGRCFRNASNLKSHLVIHSGARPFKCEICDSGFSHPNSLKTHRYIHTDERPHKCNQCEKGFVSSSGLKIHLREHTGERPYACTICEMKFANKCHFNRHIISHSNRRPFECSKCNKAFKHRETFNKHMICHTNEKKEVCDICEKRFIHRKNLVQHMKIHTILKQYSCTLCNKHFAQNAGLYLHMKFHKNK